MPRLYDVVWEPASVLSARSPAFPLVIAVAVVIAVVVLVCLIRRRKK